MFTGGIVTRGWLVAAGDALEAAVAAEWDRGLISWWARAVVQLDEDRMWPAVALNNRETARRIASSIVDPLLALLDEDTLTLEVPGRAVHAHAGTMSFGSLPLQQLQPFRAAERTEP